MQYIVDRIEGDYIVCEDEQKQMYDFKKERFPSEVKQGDVVVCQDEQFVINEEETKKRAEYIRSLMDDMWE